MRKLKKQECEDAEKENDNKCLGYSLWNDDEPIEQCKKCKKHSSYNKNELK